MPACRTRLRCAVQLQGVPVGAFAVRREKRNGWRTGSGISKRCPSDPSRTARDSKGSCAQLPEKLCYVYMGQRRVSAALIPDLADANSQFEGVNGGHPGVTAVHAPMSPGRLAACREPWVGSKPNLARRLHLPRSQMQQVAVVREASERSLASLKLSSEEEASSEEEIDTEEK